MDPVSLNNIDNKVWRSNLVSKASLATMFAASIGVGYTVVGCVLKRMTPISALVKGGGSFGVYMAAHHIFWKNQYSPAQEIIQYICEKKGELNSDEISILKRCQKGVTELVLNEDECRYTAEIIAMFDDLKKVSIDSRKWKLNRGDLAEVTAFKPLDELHINALTIGATHVSDEEMLKKIEEIPDRLTVKFLRLTHAKSAINQLIAKWLTMVTYEQLEVPSLLVNEVKMLLPSAASCKSLIMTYYPEEGASEFNFIPENIGELSSLTSIVLKDYPDIFPVQANCLSNCANLKMIRFNASCFKGDAKAFEAAVQEFETNDANADFMTAFKRLPITPNTHQVAYERKPVK
jgi:hypothetical protein